MKNNLVNSSAGLAIYQFPASFIFLKNTEFLIIKSISQ